MEKKHVFFWKDQWQIKMFKVMKTHARWVDPRLVVVVDALCNIQEKVEKYNCSKRM